MSVELKTDMNKEEVERYAFEHAGEMFNYLQTIGRMAGTFGNEFLIEYSLRPALNDQEYGECLTLGCNFVINRPIKSCLRVLPKDLSPLETFTVTGGRGIRMENLHPHSCPSCKAPAYIGFTTIECSKNCGVR